MWNGKAWPARDMLHVKVAMLSAVVRITELRSQQTGHLCIEHAEQACSWPQCTAFEPVSMLLQLGRFIVTDCSGAAVVFFGRQQLQPSLKWMAAFYVSIAGKPGMARTDVRTVVAVTDCHRTQVFDTIVGSPATCRASG